ncbi:MAG TPA: phosphoglycerate kinase [Candidatus Paceibacterota bacterium]|nr:phosphoglycerate kinase [Candidatus Pacearchaeota archaeon]HRZ50650.1 phosphoglycerate kinase [Candidatus Paceibacterota bacterium]HSA36453.1 phosphoglycerate kinase [Candidatus Paceibacterota bacterium]
MRTLNDFDFENKKTLVRCDFNVGMNDKGGITDDFRIVKSIPTIKHLLERKAIVILMSHLEKKDKCVSLKAVAERLENILGQKVKFISSCVGSSAAKETNKLKSGEVALLENLRFEAGEKANDDGFARELAKLGEVYVNEAFACSHRAHASIVGIPKYLPSYAGLLMESEVLNLEKILKNPERPFIVIIGGTKVETKIKTILNISQIADHILFGSKIGEIILIQKEIMLGRELAVKEKLVEKIDLTNSKIHLPVDGMMALKDLSEGYSRKAGIGTIRKEEEVYDIGPETIKVFKEIIKGAKTIFFNGPMGMFENREFVNGTKEILDAIAKNRSAFKVAGGGETVEAINKFHAAESFNFLSTGGGAMLEFLSGDKLPGVEALN